MKIKLTEAQLKKLQPFLDAVEKHNQDKNSSGYLAIAAQLYRDGMVVKLLNLGEAKKLGSALGNTLGKTSASVSER
jgi:hypothetical protein